jgi:membrane protein YdbS with pleckstrin-like domain
MKTMSIYEEQETRLTNSPIVDDGDRRRTKVRSGPPRNVKLGRDEHIVQTIRPHWSGIVPGLLFLIGLFIVPVTLYAVGRAQWGTLALLVLALAEPLLLLVLMQARRANSLIVTNKRLICTHGIFDHVHRGVPIGHITNVSAHHDFIQGLLGTGTVEVDISGQFGPEIFPNIPDPDEVAELLIEEVEDFESAVSRAVATNKTGVQPSAPAPRPLDLPTPASRSLDEIERLHHLLSEDAITQEEYDFAKATLLQRF